MPIERTIACISEGGSGATIVCAMRMLFAGSAASGPACITCKTEMAAKIADPRIIAAPPTCPGVSPPAVASLVPDWGGALASFRLSDEIAEAVDIFGTGRKRTDEPRQHVV